MGLGLAACLATSVLLAQEQVDRPDEHRPGPKAAAPMTMRVRVTKCVPQADVVLVRWRRGGEGLGGTVIHGAFFPETTEKPAQAPDPLASRPLTEAGPGDQRPESAVSVGEWTRRTPVETVVGRTTRWEFPTITVEIARDKQKRIEPPSEIAVEFEFAHGGKAVRQFVETSPRGATVGFAFPGALLSEKGPGDPAFAAALQGLSGHARSRRERLEKAIGAPSPPLKHLAVLGHLAGYGQGPGGGVGKAAGYGVRHCNPEIVAEECRTLRLLGVNALVGANSLRLADAAGVGGSFRQLFWGGPGSGSPMGFVTKRGAESEGCPFDPKLKPAMAESIRMALDEHRAAKARRSWGLWWDEIGVAAKEHIVGCTRCAEQFRDYLRKQGIGPASLGKASWEEVTPYPLWTVTPGPKPKPSAGPAPQTAAECLRYYYTYRFMTFATANLFPESAKTLQQAGISLYAMQGPTPSWSGHSLDWHEFYDLGANTALVFETSNRDPRVWQWESYLGDIMRGISARHRLPIGCLVKPHRGAASQRMLSVVARGAEAVEWYTYGPDYAKGDSFSQSAELLEEVGRAGRFLYQAEEHLAGARWAHAPEVAFVSPRSSEIWGRAGELGVTAFEDAKWVYLALAHAHIPVDVLSEQQLAEGKLDKYKAAYVVGPNLCRDAAAKLAQWVRDGGTLWTDALGLARDEANQPAIGIEGLFPQQTRKLERWGSVPEYRATALEELKETDAPAGAAFSWKAGSPWGQGQARARVGREVLSSVSGDVIARFADGTPAVVRRPCGKGEVVHAAFWAGLSYSAKLRRKDFDMRADLDSALPTLIAAPALARGVCRPVTPSDPLVEAVLLEKGGKRSIALMNWGYRSVPGARPSAALQPAKDLSVGLPGLAEVKSVRSIRHGALTIRGAGEGQSAVLPELTAIDLLLVE